MKHPSLSVIVPVHNREEQIKVCLASILASDFKDFELIVVDDGSTDGTLQAIRKFPCTVIHNPTNQGAGNARNRGAAEANGRYLVFIDSDVRLPKDTLSKTHKIIKKRPGIPLFCGYKRRVQESGPASSRYVMLRKTYGHGTWRKAVSMNSFLETAYFVIQKDIFSSEGGFAEYSRSGGEEHEFGHRLSARYDLLFMRELGVIHRYEPIFDYMRKLPRRSRAWGQLFFRKRRFEKKGFGTKREAINASLAGIAVLGTLGMISPYLYLFFTASLILILRRFPFHLLVFKKMGLGWMLISPFIDISLYLMNLMGAITALYDRFTSLVRSAATLISDSFFVLISRTPQNIGFFVTSRCNLSCKHCFYWKETSDQSRRELTLAEIAKISSSLDTVYYLTITGGEPSLREDLPDIVSLFYTNNHLRLVSYHTNGLMTGQIVDHIDRMLETCPGLAINVAISLDGPEEVHDHIRGKKGSFASAHQTFDALAARKRRTKNLDVQFSGVFSAFSKDHMLQTYQEIRGKGDWYGNTFIRGDVREASAKAVCYADYLRFKKSISASRTVRKRIPFSSRAFSFIRNSIARMVMGHYILANLKTGKQSLPCKAGKNTIVISDIGDVYACENNKSLLGSLRTQSYDVKEILRSSRARKAIMDIRKGRCCCTHEGNMYVNVIFNPIRYPAFIYRYIQRWLAR